MLERKSWIPSGACVLFAACVFAAGAAPAGAAAISVLNTDALVTNSTTSTYTITSFDPGAGSSKLVVTAAAEGSGGPKALLGITFGGVPLLEAINETNSIGNPDHRVAIYYLDNPGAAAGDIVATWEANANGTGMSALSLSGTTAGVAGTNPSTTSNSVSITTTVADTFLVATFIDNDGATMSVDAPLIELFGGGDIGSAEAAAGYRNVAAPGLVTASATGGPASREAAVVAIFTPVPEPATLALAAVGLAGLRRRRR